MAGGPSPRNLRINCPLRVDEGEVFSGNFQAMEGYGNSIFISATYPVKPALNHCFPYFFFRLSDEVGSMPWSIAISGRCETTAPCGLMVVLEQA